MISNQVTNLCPTSYGCAVVFQHDAAAIVHLKQPKEHCYSIHLAQSWEHQGGKKRGRRKRKRILKAVVFDICKIRSEMAVVASTIASRVYSA